MVTLTIKIIDITKGVDWLGNPCRYVTFKVVEWPEFGPFSLPFPLIYTKAEARAAIDARVMELTTGTHEWYGIEWTVTVP